MRPLFSTKKLLFAPSGTQSEDLLALAHCDRGDEYLVGDNARTFRYEGGGAAHIETLVRPSRCPWHLMAR